MGPKPFAPLPRPLSAGLQIKRPKNAATQLRVLVLTPASLGCPEKLGRQSGGPTHGDFSFCGLSPGRAGPSPPAAGPRI